MRSVVHQVAAFLVTVAIAVACAPQTEVVKLYDEPTRAQSAFKHLLIVDVSSDRSQRQLFEDELAVKLRREGVVATPSYTHLDASQGLLQDDINRVSKELGADGILVTHIASVDTSVDKEGGRDQLRSTCRGGDPVDYFLYDHKIIREPESLRFAHTVIVITNLYDATTQNRIWTIQSTCFEKSSISDVLQDESGAIVRQLRIDKLI